MNMKTWNMCGAAVVLAAVMLWLSGCVETDADKRENAPTHEIAKADQYAIDVLETYYLWNEEIEKDLAGSGHLQNADGSGERHSLS